MNLDIIIPEHLAFTNLALKEGNFGRPNVKELDVDLIRDNKGEITKKTKRNLINVFVPTTPNPTSGFLLMFPKEEVIYLDLTFEEASKFIVSAGTSNPD